MTDPATRTELEALLAGAATLSRAGNRVAAIATLLSAIALDPDDRTAHRRLAAAYALAGDRAQAAAEYDRFVARLTARGDLAAAAIERSYAAALLAPSAPRPAALPAPHQLTPDQSFALRRVAVALLGVGVTFAAMLAAGAQIFAKGG